MCQLNLLKALVRYCTGQHRLHFLFQTAFCYVAQDSLKVQILLCESLKGSVRIENRPKPLLHSPRPAACPVTIVMEIKLRALKLRAQKEIYLVLLLLQNILIPQKVQLTSTGKIKQSILFLDSFRQSYQSSKVTVYKTVVVKLPNAVTL